VPSTAGLAAWSELNDRQRGVLAVVYELDQLAEAAHRGASAAGQYDRRSASIWRAIDEVAVVLAEIERIRLTSGDVLQPPSVALPRISSST
jgi:hypothetical protein